MEILVSKTSPLIKTIYGDNQKYYTVSFFSNENNDSDKMSLIICVSTQIGCKEKCKFCATGDNKLIRNLSHDEIGAQILDSINLIKGSYLYKKYNPEKLYIIFEGMGEVNDNIENTLLAIKKIFPIVMKEDIQVAFRFSSVGNIELKDSLITFFSENKYIKDKVEIEVKLSLHTPFTDEREYLCPVVSKKHSLKEILDDFYEISDFFNQRLICNYMLLDYPNGLTNYTKEHFEELAKILSRNKTTIWLGKYSDTNKGFKSPGEETYNFAYNLIKNYYKFNAEITDLQGEDVGAACGMLDYTY